MSPKRLKPSVIFYFSEIRSNVNCKSFQNVVRIKIMLRIQSFNKLKKITLKFFYTVPGSYLLNLRYC